MVPEVRLIVVDAGPLITRAAAQSLDYLLYPDLPVLVPDAVFHEATSAAGKLGAQEIIEWYRVNTHSVRVEPTEIFQREMTLLELQGGRLSRDVGERAALARRSRTSWSRHRGRNRHPPLNVPPRGNPFGGSRPAWARSPTQSRNVVSVRVLSPNRQVSPSERRNTLASFSPPSL